jgi:hypothetical protein
VVKRYGSEMLPSTARQVNRVALALLIAALVCWIAFHLLPMDRGGGRGWELWRQILRAPRRGSMFGWENLLSISGFLTLALLVPASPFLAPLLRSSAPCRWLAVLASGAALANFGGALAATHDSSFAFGCLVASIVLNFIGLVCIRHLRSA